MKITKLDCEDRPLGGSQNCKRARLAGRMPAILYGLGRKEASISVDSHTFTLEIERGSRMFHLHRGENTQLCLVKAVQFDALGSNMIHADFLRVEDSEKLIVSVGLNFVGIADEAAGAVVDHPRSDIEVSCLPLNMPKALDVNIDGLKVGEQITAGQVELPDGVDLVTAADEVVATHHYKHVAAEPDEGDEGAEPEVLTEKKPDAE